MINVLVTAWVTAVLVSCAGVRHRGIYNAGGGIGMTRMSFAFLQGTTPTDYLVKPNFLTSGFEGLTTDILNYIELNDDMFHNFIDSATTAIKLENISQEYNDAFADPPPAVTDFEDACHALGGSVVQKILRNCATMSAFAEVYIKKLLLIFSEFLEGKTREYVHNCSLLLDLLPQRGQTDDATKVAVFRRFHRLTCRRIVSEALAKLVKQVQNAAKHTADSARLLPELPFDVHDYAQRYRDEIRRGTAVWFGTISSSIASEQHNFMARYDMALDSIFNRINHPQGA